MCLARLSLFIMDLQDVFIYSRIQPLVRETFVQIFSLSVSFQFLDGV